MIKIGNHHAKRRMAHHMFFIFFSQPRHPHLSVSLFPFISFLFLISGFGYLVLQYDLIALINPPSSLSLLLSFLPYPLLGPPLTPQGLELAKAA